jgi:ribosomal protein RSM22 (predicted rRNA methylase)
MKNVKENLVNELRKIDLPDMCIDIYAGFYDLLKEEKRDVWANDVIDALKKASSEMSSDDLKKFMILNTLRLAAVITNDAEFHNSLLPQYKSLFESINWKKTN